MEKRAAGIPPPSFDHRPVFGAAIPVLIKPREAFLALGVPIRPTADHWYRFFNWIRQQAVGSRVLPRRARDTLLRAYERLDLIPAGLPFEWPVVLDDRGTLHSKKDVARQRVLIDDEPLLAATLREADSEIAFAFPDSHITPCLERTGVRRLSEIARVTGVTPGPEVEGAELTVVPKLLARLADPEFASAAAALAAAICGPSEARRRTAIQKRLQSIDEIAVTTHIHRHHRVGSTVVMTPVDHHVEAHRIIVAKARTQEQGSKAADSHST